MKVSGSVAVVTGANRGIGKAVVAELLKQGAAKVYAAARKPADLAAVVALDPARVRPLTLDVTDAKQVAAAAAAAPDVTLLVNNAGALGSGELFDTPDAALRNDMEVNYFGLIAVTKAFAPHLERNGGGAVVNLLSVVSLASMPGIAGYNASKAAAFSVTQALRPRLAAKKIRVVGVFPGPIDTDMAKDIPMDKTPPDVVARAIVAGIEADAEDVYPDPMAAQVGAAWQADPKAVEKQFAAM